MSIHRSIRHTVHHRLRHGIRQTALGAGLVGAVVCGLAATAPAASAASVTPKCLFGIAAERSDATPNCGQPKRLVVESLTADQNPVTEGQPVTFSVSVAPQSGTGTPAGTVAISLVDPVTQNKTQIGSAVLADGIATWTTSSLPVGIDGLYAAYSGDFIFNGGFATYFEQVDPIPPVPPVVASIVPKKGPSGGGTVVTITGENLDTATVITVGTVPVTSFSCSSATACTFVTPDGSGRQHVRVTSPAGTSTKSAADKFNFKVINP